MFGGGDAMTTGSLATSGNEDDEMRGETSGSGDTWMKRSRTCIEVQAQLRGTQVPTQKVAAHERAG